MADRHNKILQMPGFLSATLQSGILVKPIFSKSRAFEGPDIADTFTHISIQIFDTVFQASTARFHQMPDLSWVIAEEGRSIMKETNY